jgi:hypothetical protein
MTIGRSWGAELDTVPTPAIPPRANGAVTKLRRDEGLVYQRMYEWISYPDEAPLEDYRDDPNNTEEPIKQRPAAWWSPRSIGFRARILVNPLGGEVRIVDRKFIRWLIPSSIEERGSLEEEYLTALAPRVIAWEYVIVDEDGARNEIEPPAVGGWERFLDLPTEAYAWLTNEIREAHRPKVTTPVGKPATTPDLPTEPSIQMQRDPALDYPEESFPPSSSNPPEPNSLTSA